MWYSNWRCDCPPSRHDPANVHWWPGGSRTGSNQVTPPPYPRDADSWEVAKSATLTPISTFPTGDCYAARLSWWRRDSQAEAGSVPLHSHTTMVHTAQRYFVCSRIFTLSLYVCLFPRFTAWPQMTCRGGVGEPPEAPRLSLLTSSSGCRAPGWCSEESSGASYLLYYAHMETHFNMTHHKCIGNNSRFLLIV